MTSFMNLIVRVNANRAMAVMARFRGEIAATNAATMAANRGPRLGERHISSLMKFGNQLQWTGRMLQYNFTIPILAAGAAATHFALEQDKAMTHVAKVYGDTEAAAKQFRKEQGLGAAAARKLANSYRTEELEALDDAFTAISAHYGVQKKEVLEVAGAWAAAGASGRDLAESVNTTMKAIIIGDMQAAEATKALISIQAQYNLNSQQLMATLANLNSVENQTGASMNDLIIGFEKAAGVARSAGIETNQLAAYMAALVPATGSAASAGNALKTIISRLMSPTKEAKQVMEAMGLEVTAMSWQNATATERLKIMAKEFNNLGSGAQNAAASVIASRWQVNRFEVLMRELINTNGFYVKALKASEDQAGSFKRMQKELNTVLESDPRRMQRMWVMLQNASVEIIQPLIPHILYLVNSLARMAGAFSNLSPEMQKFVMLSLLLLAAIGPVVRYMGALTTLFAVVGKGALILAGGLFAVVGGLMSLTFTPLLRALAIFATWIGATSSVITAEMGLWAIMYTGFAGFLKRWTKLVAAIFRAGNLINLSIVVTGWLAQLTFMRGALAAKIGLLKIFFVKMQIMFVAGSIANQSIWATMWSMLKLITAAGIASQVAKVGAFAVLVGMIQVVGTAIIAAWQGMWAAISIASGAGWALIQAQWAVAGILHVSLWRTLTLTSLIGANRIAAIQAVWAVTIGAIFTNLKNFLSLTWAITMTRLKVISTLYQVGEIGRWAAFWAATKLISMAGAISMVSVAGAMWTTLTLLTRIAFSRLAGMYVAAQTFLTMTWAITLTRLKVLSLLYQMGELTRWAAFWAATKLVTMAGALSVATVMGLMWTTIKKITMAGALVTAMISGVLWRTLIGGAAATGGSVALLFTRLRGALVVIWSTTALAASTIWKAMAVSMIVFSRAAVVGIIGAFKALIPLMARIFAMVLGPWGIAIMAVLALTYAFSDELKEIWGNILEYFGASGTSINDIFASIGNGIMSAFSSLPQGVQDVMVSIVTIIRDAALAVYDWFQYINPWAHHSPSLVENVTTGMDAVVKNFSKLGSIKRYTSAAYAEIKRFGELTSKIGLSSQAVEQKENRKTIKKAGGGGEALKSYDRMIGMIKTLTPLLAQLESKVNAQQSVVDDWTRKLNQANKALDVQQEKLDDLRNVLQGYQDALDAAEGKLDYYASAPLQGMRAMDDQIFANTMQQKRLRLEMMKMEDVVGNLDDIKSKIEAINGAQELMRGTQADLRAAGAGSEILGFYDDEIKKLEDQKGAYNQSASALDEMQKAMDALTREAERLDLVKSLKFDELSRQIEQAADRTKELSFDEIMAGIAGANREIDKYTPLVQAATQAVADQQKVVDEATAARDRVQERLDREQETLDVITGKYEAIRDTIQSIENAISDVVSASEKLNDSLEKKKEAEKAKKKGAGEEYISPGLQNFIDAGKADFPDPGGKGIPPRTDWSSQAADIEKFTETLGADTASLFEQLNPFAPLKGKALAAWGWIKDKAGDAAAGITDFFSNIFDGVTFGSEGKFDKITDTLETIGGYVTGEIKSIMKKVKKVWELLWPEIEEIGTNLKNAFTDAWKKIGPKLAEFKELIKPLGEALKNAWDIAKPILGIFALGFIIFAKVLLSTIAELIGPAIDTLAAIFGGVIDIVKGVIKILIAIFTGDWPLLWSGIVDVVQGTWDLIWGVISGAGSMLWNLVEGIVKGIWQFFVWLADILVGHSVVPDMINAIIDVFHWLADLATWVWDNVLKPVWDFFVAAYDNVIASLSLWWDAIKTTWSALKSAGQWIWENVLKPVWDKFKKVWDENIQPFLAGWWEGIKLEWAMLKTAAQWVWENVLKPVWDKFKKVWDENIQPFLAGWWEGIKLAFGFLLGLGTWFWENVLKPVWGVVKDVWQENIKPGLEGWWEGIKLAFNALIGLGNWFQTNVLDPVKTAFVSTFQSIKKWFEDNSDIFTKPVETIVNVVISAVNAIITGLNKVADILPGVDWHIDGITPVGLAQGGAIPSRKANRGFMTNGARAIVGEGKANHPEFVIPTDPTYRTRAKSLLAMAAQKLGDGNVAAALRNSPALDEHGIPQYAVGGWLDDKWKKTKGIAKKIAKLPENAVRGVMDKVLSKAQEKVDKTSWTPTKVPPSYAIKELRQWVAKADAEAKSVIDKMVPSGGNVPVGDPDSPTLTSSWKGGVFSNRFIAHMEKAEELAGSSLGVIQGGFRPATPWSGTSHQGDAIDFQVNNALITALRRVGIAAGDRTGLGNWDPHSHAIPGPSAGTAAGSATWQWQDYLAKGGMNQPLNSTWGLAKGAIIRGGRGGVNTRIGEGLNDELVTPLPANWKTSDLGGGGKTFNFYGELVFPNIQNGDDAEDFITNLENLVD